MKKEIWKDIIGYEGLYQVSNLGRVKSLGNDKSKKEKILKIRIGTKGYFIANIRKDKKSKAIDVHQLVAIAFLNHTPCGFKLVVNHIDFNKQNNNVDNLEIITHRENTNRKHIESTSKYVGVYLDKCSGKWASAIRINGKKKYLGRFENEQEASRAYQTALVRL
jgi:hypothetical protein